tara:strand:+ start:49 stop:450 length:402 start_codon:yes stop_codon:yes gene_type:complete
MKLTKEKLQQIIKEELDNMISEESSDIGQKYPDHYDFLLSALEKGHVGDNRSEKYMTLVSWLTRGAITDLEAVEDNEARKLIDAAKEESMRRHWEKEAAKPKREPEPEDPEAKRKREIAFGQAMARGDYGKLD